MTSDLPAARDVLASGHPLSRILDQLDTMRMQTLACLALLAGATAGAYPSIADAGALAMADTAVVIVLASLLLILRGERYRRARTVLIHRGAVDLLELRDVQRRLSTRARRAALAAELNDALELALTWHATPVARRPPPGVLQLRCHVGAVRQIVASLSEAETDLRAVALVEELLDGGYSAPLYHLDALALGDALGRVRFLLATFPPRCNPV